MKEKGFIWAVILSSALLLATSSCGPSKKEIRNAQRDVIHEELPKLIHIAACEETIKENLEAFLDYADDYTEEVVDEAYDDFLDGRTTLFASDMYDLYDALSLFSGGRTMEQEFEDRIQDYQDYLEYAIPMFIEVTQDTFDVMLYDVGYKTIMEKGYAFSDLHPEEPPFFDFFAELTCGDLNTYDELEEHIPALAAEFARCAILETPMPIIKTAVYDKSTKVWTVSFLNHDTMEIVFTNNGTDVHDMRLKDYAN